jgi:hypothetical protein
MAQMDPQRPHSFLARVLRVVLVRLRRCHHRRLRIWMCCIHAGIRMQWSSLLLAAQAFRGERDVELDFLMGLLEARGCQSGQHLSILFALQLLMFISRH